MQKYFVFTANERAFIGNGDFTQIDNSDMYKSEPGHYTITDKSENKYSWDVDYESNTRVVADYNLFNTYEEAQDRFAELVNLINQSSIK